MASGPEGPHQADAALSGGDAKKVVSVYPLNYLLYPTLPTQKPDNVIAVSDRVVSVVLTAWRKFLVSLIITFIRLYRIGISPFFPPSCRYEPTCSQYTIDAFIKYKPSKATLLSLKRILSCHPWSRGGYRPA